MKTIDHRTFWPKLMVVLGSIGMLAGALDPLEGCIVILIGSALVALGTFLSQNERCFLGYRLLVFILVAIGVVAMLALTSIGGFGGNSGRTMWWGALILPYLIGWSMGIWGPGNPRWFLYGGIGAALWYLFLCGMVLSHPTKTPSAPLVIAFGTIAMITIAGCIARLRHHHLQIQAH